MAAELRWILLALSLVLLGGIWWWGRRRSSQAPGDAQLREMTSSIELQRPEAETEIEAEIEPEIETEIEAEKQWGVPPFEPLSIHTQEYERVPVLDGPMMVSADPAPVLASGAAAPAMSATHPATPIAAPGAELIPGRVPTLLPETANASEQQKIVTVRVCAPGEVRWPGATLLSALELHGLAYGRYQVFHRRHVDGRSLFCVASLIEPGTFDVARMSTEEYRGVTLFAVLPGPVEPLLTVDELLGAARGLAQELSGMVQDHKGMPLSPQRAAALRDDVARFQASLPRA
ncbi:MAG TPA: cell division protein ZipA C-terminal FtsZ-binding domain-containing protein [Steroidobacteraceae bacterium]